MKNRLLKFLSVNNLTATRFADEIGVQRSSISHILSGRNKPSFDFINKTLEKYTELNAEWLITGKGEMYKTNKQQTSARYKELDLFSSNQNIVTTQKKVTEKEKSDVPDDKQVTNTSPVEKIDQKPFTTRKSINKVIIFYADGSFEEYNPSVNR